MTESATNLEAAAVLYQESARRAAAVSDRQFAVTLQTLALHGAVFAALVTQNPELSDRLQLLALAAIFVLDALAVIYLWQKAGSYWQSIGLNDAAEVVLREAAGIADETSPQKGASDDGRALRGFGGTAYFIAAVALSGVVTMAVVCAA